MKIVFAWEGITGRYGFWRDGLWAALKLIEKEHEVVYQEPSVDIPEDADVILYWEAPCTSQNPDFKSNYLKIQFNDKPKILLFAGGPIEKRWCEGFDMLLVESKINEEECETLGIPWQRAFGINTDIFYPQNLEEKYDAIHHGTCAGWKRQQILGESLGDRAIVVGRYQKSDPYPFQRCRDLGVTVLDEQSPEEVAKLINQSKCLLQTSSFWGGGQRATLEAMACNIPVICMEDSPKNREYVEESGFGLVCSPDDRERLKKAVEYCDVFKAQVYINQKPAGYMFGRDYVMSKWTPRHYADNILKAINTIIK